MILRFFLLYKVLHLDIKVFNQLLFKMFPQISPAATFEKMFIFSFNFAYIPPEHFSQTTIMYRFYIILLF